MAPFRHLLFRISINNIQGNNLNNMIDGKKIVVLPPPNNAEKTITKTYNDIPVSIVDDALLVEDTSNSNTAEISHPLGNKLIFNINNFWNKYKARKYFCYLLGLSCVLMICIICISVLASVPPTSRDALTHHLFVPKLYIEHGGIYEIPNIPFSYYPMNLDLLYMIPLYFGNDIIPKYLHFLFALLTALLIFNYLKNRTNSLYALLGSLFFLSIPIIVKLSITVYVDLGLMFFTTASLIAYFSMAEFRLQTTLSVFSRYLLRTCRRDQI